MSQRDLTFHAYGMMLEPLGIEHLELVRYWRNHPDVRSFMLQQQLIDRKTHQDWFKHLQIRDDEKHFIVYTQEQPVASTNIRTSDGQAVTKSMALNSGLYVAPQTLSQTMLAFLPALAFHEMIFSTFPCRTLHAIVLKKNTGALRFNRTLGYVDASQQDMECDYIRMSLPQENHVQARLRFRRFNKEVTYE